MNGKIACLIVIASVFVTGFTGYLANADVESAERQVYDYSANLVPSIVSSDVTQYESYNPSTNVVGWANNPSKSYFSNATIETTNSVSPYILTPRIVRYNPQTPVDISANAYAITSSSEITHDYSSTHKIDVDVVSLNQQNTAYEYLHIYLENTGDDPIFNPNIVTKSEGWVISESGNSDSRILSATFIGGTRANTTWTEPVQSVEWTVSTKVVYADSTTVSNDADTPLYITPFSIVQNNISTLKTSDVIDVTGMTVLTTDSEGNFGLIPTQYYSTVTVEKYTIQYSLLNAESVYDGNPVYDSDNNQVQVGLMYQSDVNGWYMCRKDPVTGFWFHTSEKKYDANMLFTVAFNTAPVSTFNYEKVQTTNAVYADNTKMVTIGNEDPVTHGGGYAGVWENGEQNGRVDLLAKLTATTGNLTIQTYSKTFDEENDPNHTSPIYTLNGQFLADGGSIVTPTGYVQIVLDRMNGTATMSPVTSFADTLTYSTSGYTVDLPVSVGFGETDIARLSLTYANNVGEGYVESTVIQLDPNGMLWSNPSVYLQYYYPDSFNNISLSNIPRVWFNAFVSLGTSITINGIEYPVSDGTITVNNTDVTLKGMAVDWRNDNGTIHVYIVPNGDDSKSIDVGPVDTSQETAYIKTGGTYADAPTVVGYNIKAEGVWYFEFGLYNGYTEIYDKVNLNITKGWGLSLQGACLLFAGSVILCTAVAGYYGRDRPEYGLELMDWVIIILVLVVTIAVGGML